MDKTSDTVAFLEEIREANGRILAIRQEQVDRAVRLAGILPEEEAENYRLALEGAKISLAQAELWLILGKRFA